MDLGSAAGQVTVICGAILAAAGVLALAWRMVRALWRRGRQVGHLLDDVLGEPARGDQPERPGLMARVGRIEAELHPNHGSSLRDVADRVERRLDEHLAEHRRAREGV